MAHHAREAANRRASYARLAGLAYLVIIASGIYAEFFVRSALIVHGDPGATASAIAASEGLYRSALAAEFVMLAADVFLALALLVVFRTVSRDLALLAAFFRLTHASIVGASLLLTYVPLLLVKGVAGGGEGPGPGGAEALVGLALDAHGFGYTIGLVFFGVHCLVLAALVLRSPDIPRVLGALLGLAGAGYLIDSGARTLMETYHQHEPLFTTIVFVPAFVGELSFALWLLIRGSTLGDERPPADP